jgi:hypothetical protein
MGVVREQPAGDDQRHIRPPGRIKGQMDALFRADPAQHQGEAPFRVRQRAVADRDAVRDRRQQPGAGGGIAALGIGHTVQPQVGARGLQRRGRIPAERQVQGDEGRTIRRQVGVEVDAVQMDEVDRPAAPAFGDDLALRRPRPLPRRVVQRPDLRRDRAQGAGDLGAFAGHHQRPVPGPDQRVVEGGQHLLCPADRVRADRRQRIRDVEHRQDHGGGSSSSSATAAATRPGHSDPVIPQG